MVARERRPLLIAAAVCCAVALTGLLGLPAEIVGAVVCTVALLLVAQDARVQSPAAGPLNWWNTILAGLIIWAVGIPLELLVQPIGGLLEAIGAALCLIGSLLGTP